MELNSEEIIRSIEKKKYFLDFLKEKENGKLTHAYAFYSDDKLTLKYLLNLCAAVVCCSRNGCGICSVCNKIKKNIYAEVMTVSADKIKVDDIEKIKEDIQLLPYEGDCKVYILLNAETMNESAQNKLLKLIEEPVQNAVFLFGVSDEFSLLPTIKSRMKHIDVEKFTTSEILDMESFKKSVKDIKTAELAAVISEGNLTLASNIVCDEKFNFLYNLATNLYLKLKNSKCVVSCIAEITPYKDDINIFLNILLIFTKDMLMYEMGKSDFVSLKNAEKEMVSVLWEFNTQSLMGIIEKINSTKRKLVLNCNPVLAAEKLFFDILEVKYICRT